MGPNAVRAARTARSTGLVSSSKSAASSASTCCSSTESMAFAKRWAMLLLGERPKPSTCSRIHTGAGSPPLERSHMKQLFHHSEGCVANWLKKAL